MRSSLEWDPYELFDLKSPPEVYIILQFTLSHQDLARLLVVTFVRVLLRPSLIWSVLDGLLCYFQSSDINICGKPQISAYRMLGRINVYFKHTHLNTRICHLSYKSHTDILLVFEDHFLTDVILLFFCISQKYYTRGNLSPDHVRVISKKQASLQEILLQALESPPSRQFCEIQWAVFLHITPYWKEHFLLQFKNAFCCLCVSWYTTFLSSTFRNSYVQDVFVSLLNAFRQALSKTQMFRILSFSTQFFVKHFWIVNSVQ